MFFSRGNEMRYGENLLRTGQYLLVVLILGGGNAIAAQQTLQLLPLEPGDVSSESIHKLGDSELVNRSRDDVAFSWPVDVDRKIVQNSSYASISRSYWRRVSAIELSEGIAIGTTAPGALVRISAGSKRDSARLDAQSSLSIEHFGLIDPQGVEHSLPALIEKSASFEQLGAVNIGFASGTFIFKLDPNLGMGEFTLVSKGNQNESDHYIVYVYDKNSDYVMNMQLPQTTVFEGDTLIARLALEGAYADLPVRLNNAFVIGPAGQRIALGEADYSGRTLELRFFPEDLVSHSPGLWEVHASIGFTIDGQEVQRNTKNAVAINRAGATLTGEVGIHVTKGKKMILNFGLSSKSAGRYEVRGVLYGTDKNGHMKPIMFGSSAGWREPGESRIGLELQLSKLGHRISPPYELRHLMVYDQSRLMLLRKQSRALRIE